MAFNKLVAVGGWRVVFRKFGGKSFLELMASKRCIRPTVGQSNPNQRKWIGFSLKLMKLVINGTRDLPGIAQRGFSEMTWTLLFRPGSTERQGADQAPDSAF